MQLNMLEAMNIYVNVVEQGSFIRAAEVLELHRPAVTRAVQNLEHDLGVKLLHRTTRQVSMTDEGEEFYQRCLSLLSELDDVRRLFSRTQPPKGRLRLDVPITLARAVIIPALGDFQNRYPDIEIVLGTSDRKFEGDYVMKYNRICQILGIEKPVIQGPLSWLTDARLVAAVSNAGGLGVLGPNAGLTAETAVSTPEETAEKMREEIRKTKKLTEKPFGVNLIPTPENDIWTPPILQVIKEEGVKAVVYTGYGEGAIITSLFNELKASGIAIIYRDINPTPENTRLAEKAGADIIVATGFDEGGTLPGTALGTFSIVPLIADSVKSVPVMAAGGITDSRTARAAHALGAEGVFAGSVFIGTEESRVPQSVKDKIINANGLDLLLFRTLPDYYRSLPGKLADKLVSMDKAGASNEELAQTMGGLRGLRIGMLEGNTDEGYIALGTGIGNIRSIKSVAEVVNELAIC
ncbi:LysR family transcriptional regulator [Salmonella enterica]|nr:LysR family transcriptional regulator [Salmonella enterica]